MRTGTIEYAIHMTDSILGAIEFVKENYGVDYIQGIEDDVAKLKMILKHIQSSGGNRE